MAPAPVYKALRVLCNGELAMSPNPDPTWGFKVLEISNNDPIFNGAGILSKVSELCGLPLLLRKDPTPITAGFGEPELLNKNASLLFTNPRTGVIPTKWQTGIGSVVVAREDRKPLLEGHFEVFAEYVSMELYDYYVSGNPQIFIKDFTRARFEEYWENVRRVKLNGNGIEEHNHRVMCKDRDRYAKTVPGPWDM